MSKKDIINNFEDVKEEFKNYIDNEIEYRKLTIVEKLSRVSVSIISNIIVLYFLLLILLFSSIAAGFYLGDILNSVSLGFIIIAGLYLLILVIIILLKRYIIEKPVIKSFIKLFFQNKDN